MQLREASKYQHVWSHQEYRNARNAKAGQRVPQLVHHFRSHNVRSVIDVGVGTGKTAHLLTEQGFDVEGLDIVNALEYPIPTAIAPAWGDQVASIGRYDAVMCIDVLEHIPEELVGKTLRNIERLAPHGYLVIALRPERLNYGEPLHLTVESADWWNEKIPFADIQPNLSGTHAIGRY